MEIRKLHAGDDLFAVSRVYEESWRGAYRGLLPQEYLDALPAGNWVPYLEQTGRRLKIYDAFRPVAAHRLLFAAIPQDGFFIPEASRSPHCRGTAVDVALLDADGVELPYPTLVDAYDENFAKDVQAGNLQGFFRYLQKASLDYQDDQIPEAIRNRDELYSLMQSVGLVPAPRRHEWWHYELPDGRTEKYPLIDFK